MQTYVMIQNGRVGWGVIGMNNVVELLPKLVGALVGFFHPRLDRTDVKMCMMRQIIILIKRAYLLITLCKPKTAPNHKGNLYVKTMAERKLQLVAPHLILHYIASPSPLYRYSNITLTALPYNFHKS